MDYEKEIGKNIREVRQSKGLSQQKLADLCEMSNTLISQYENGKKTPGLHTVATIARALETSIDRLYYGDENKAFINAAPDIGRRIVHSVYYLWSIGVIHYYERLFVGGVPVYDKGKTDKYGFFLEINHFSRQIKRLMDSLYIFENNKKTYSEPNKYLEMILSSVATEINDEIESERAKQARPIENGAR